MMARPRKPGFARHIQITPYVRVKAKEGEGWSKSFDESARVDRALAWYDSLPKGKRQSMVWDLIIAAANGELGVAPIIDMSGGDDEEARARLRDLLENMVMDEE